jgi:hypothetical protein
MHQSLQKALYTLFFLFPFIAFCQSDSNQYKMTDAYVKSLGKLDTLNAGTISYIITKKFSNPADKVRAIFDWIADNISFECKAGRSNDNAKINADEILKSRKATAAGYAALFQDMCSVVKIRCLTVDGYVKKTVEDINQLPTEFNHTWDVVQLGQSPETWYYVDPAWGSGYTDAKMSVFTKSYNESYFFSDKTIFNLQHFPDNPAWLLGKGAKSLKEFLALPLVRNMAYQHGLSGFSPENGYIKAKAGKPVSFNIHTTHNQPIEIVSLAIGEDKKKKIKTVDYKYAGGILTFNYKFDEADSFPVTVMVNNEPMLTYFADINE